MICKTIVWEEKRLKTVKVIGEIRNVEKVGESWDVYWEKVDKKVQKK